eukprot:scaffold38245_cov33-Tisochrysis_lutea.AAC.6
MPQVRTSRIANRGVSYSRSAPHLDPTPLAGCYSGDCRRSGPTSCGAAGCAGEAHSTTMLTTATRVHKKGTLMLRKPVLQW